MKMSRSQSGIFRRIPFRRGLNLAILGMGLFTLVLILVMGETYRQLTIRAERHALSRVIQVESEQIMNKLGEDMRQLGMDIQTREEVRRALVQGDIGSLYSALEDEFHRYFVTTGAIHLRAITVLNSALQPLASARAKGQTGMPPLCPALIEAGRARSGGQRLQPLSRGCATQSRYLYQVMVPIGLVPYGYVVVSADPSYNLYALESTLDRPVRIRAPNGQLLYQSQDWSTDTDDKRVVVRYRLAPDPEARGLQIASQIRLHGFQQQLNEIEYLILVLSIVATLFTMAFAHFVARKIILDPLHELSAQLRRSDAYQRLGDRREADDSSPFEFAELQELYEALHDMAMTDPLTQLPNRMRFEQKLQRLIERTRREGGQHALCYLDLDQFKLVNDSCGHAAGDALLKRLAELFREQIRTTDTFARMGGDEFALLLENCSDDGAMRIAEQIRRAVEKFQFVWKERHFCIGISIGVVPIRGRNGNMNHILGLADAACYVAKQQGRNRVHLYRDNDSLIASRRASTQWATEIQAALDEDRFMLYVQPVYDCSGEPSNDGFNEVLLWMERSDGKRFPPARFLPYASKFNLGVEIDKRAFSLLMTHLQSTPEAAGIWSINISAPSLCDDSFLKFVVDRIDASGIDPARLVFEVNESATTADFPRSRKFIATLRGMGCRFALDDFGTGLSSFTHLQNLDIDYIKIDGSFVSRILRSEIDLQLLEAINRVAHALHIKSVAEGVENELVLHKLAAIGIDLAQGYLFGRPRALDSETPAPRTEGKDADAGEA